MLFSWEKGSALISKQYPRLKEFYTALHILVVAVLCFALVWILWAIHYRTDGKE